MTPEQEQQVARLLAETARRDQTPSMPADVSARLEDLLAELAAPRRAPARVTSERPSSADPAHRPAHRQRPRPNLLAAAAAVSVIALAGSAVATGGFGLGSDSDTSASGGHTSTLHQRADRDPDPAPSAPAPGADGPSTSQDGSRGPTEPRLRTSTLAADVRRVVAGAATAGARPRALQGSRGRVDSRSCLTPAARRGEQVVAVLLDGQPATLLLGVPRAGARAARIYACRDVTDPLASTTVRTR